MKSVLKKTVSFSLVLLLVLSCNVFNSLPGGFFERNVSIAADEGDEEETSYDYPLYNFTKLHYYTDNGSTVEIKATNNGNAFFRLNRTTIRVNHNLEYWLAKWGNNAQNKNMKVTDYDVDDYDFDTITGTQKIASTGRTFEGWNYAYEKKYTPDLNHPEQYTGYYIVVPELAVSDTGDSKQRIQFFANKLGGTSGGWILPNEWLAEYENNNNQDPAVSTSFHRDYHIYLVDTKEQPVDYYLRAGETDNTSLIGTYEKGILAPAPGVYNKLTDKEQFIYDVKPYDFSGFTGDEEHNLVIDGETYVYWDESDSDTPPTDTGHFYTVDKNQNPVFSVSGSSFRMEYQAELYDTGSMIPVTFKNGGTVLGTPEFNCGSVPSYDAPSGYTSDGQKYAFYGWKDSETGIVYGKNENLPVVIKAVTYEAVFKPVITITAKDKTKEYDGTYLSQSAFTVSGLESDDSHTFSVEMTEDSKITNYGTCPNIIATVDGVSVSTGVETEVGNYVVVTVNGELSITKRAVTITAQDKAFTYDGNAHSWPKYDVDGLVGGDAISAVVSGSITFPSESPVANVVESYEFTTGTRGNYSVTTANGQLTMTNASVAITITAASDEWTYDGSAHSNNTVTVTSGALLEGDELVATATGSVTNVADTANGNNPVAAGYKIMHGEEDVTENYVITVENGTLTINKRSVTLTSESDEKPYDGTPLTNPAVTVGGDGFVNGEVTDIKATGSVTTVAEGVVTNTITYTAGESFNEENYTITKNEGKLHISPSAKALVITSSTKSWEYDGQTHKDEVYTVTYDGISIGGSSDGPVYTFTLPTGDKITITPTTGGVIEYSSEGVTNNYIYNLQNPDCYDNVTSNKGTLSITKRPITLTANNASSEYTGSEITYATASDAVSPYYSITDGSLVEGQSITAIELSGNGTKVGEYEIVIDANSIQIGDYTGNYDPTLVPGKLTINMNSAEISVVPGSDSKMYDGTPLTKNEHEDFTVTGVPEGFTWTAVADGTVTNVVPGEDEKAVNAVTEFKIFDADGNDVTDQFSNIDKSATGTLTITARSVTLTSKSDEKEYDGTPLTSDEITTGGDGFVNGEGCTFDVTGTITNVGSEQNAFTYTLNDGTTATNYSVAIEFGTLEITPLEAVLEWSDTKFPYDGENHAPTATVSNLIDGDECKVTVTGEKKEVGEDYVATATELSNPNYKFPEKNTTSFSIYGCVVIFKNDDGTVLAKIGVPFGTKPVYEGDEPTKEPTAQYVYEFDGWTPEIVEVEAEETVYTATYQQKTRTYTVEPSELPEGVKLSITDKKTVDAGSDITFTVSVDKGYDKNDSFAVKVNGKTVTPDADGNYKISGILEDVKITVSGVEKVTYNVVDGDKTKHVIGDKTDAKFVFKRNVNDGETFGRNTAILLDGKEMTDAQYTKSSGSLIVELKADFMDTLSVGEHILTVRFDDYDGDVKATLIIEKAADPAPTTGDSGNLTLWIVIGVVSLAAFVALFLLICKRRRDEEEEEI